MLLELGRVEVKIALAVASWTMLNASGQTRACGQCRQRSALADLSKGNPTHLSQLPTSCFCILEEITKKMTQECVERLLRVLLCSAPGLAHTAHVRAVLFESFAAH